MNSRMHVPDRLRRSVPHVDWRALAAQMAHLLSPRTPDELERRRAHLLALLVVAVSGAAFHVTGLTASHAQYTVYLAAIAVAAVAGGVAPAGVATMAAFLLVGSDSSVGADATEQALFVTAGFLVAAVVGGASRRLHRTADGLAAAVSSNEELSRQVRRGHIAHDAFEHLEDLAADVAVTVVNAQGLVVEWPRSAARMYGFSSEQALGSDLMTLVGDLARPDCIEDLLLSGKRGDAPRIRGVHRRADGASVHVEFQVKPCGFHGPDHFTVAVQDLSRRRETDAFREAALRAQAALQLAADETRGQLETLESLTDPSVSVVTGAAAIEELLERLRTAVRAEGVALVQVGRAATRLVAAAGLRPADGVATGAAAGSVAADNRVALVHNDPSRVAQVSALKWAPTVSSILVVPVSHAGPIAFRLEVVNERRAPATEWDLALARIVADRLAYAMLFHGVRDSAGAVA